jgi:hypothetical protein
MRSPEAFFLDNWLLPPPLLPVAGPCEGRAFFNFFRVAGQETFSM